MKSRTITLLFLLCFMMTFLHTMPSKAASPWSMFMHDARHTGRSEYIVPDKIGQLWRTEFDGPEVTGISLSADGSTIYAGSTDHYIYALNASDGSVRWKYLAEHEIVGTPAVNQNGNIYVGSKDDYLHCLLSDGTLSWKKQLDSDAQGSPVISLQNVVFICTLNNLYAFDLDGTLLWVYDQGTSDSPSINDDGVTYIGNGKGLHAVDSSGVLKWVYDDFNILQFGVNSPSVGDGGELYITAGDSQGEEYLVALNGEGTVLWTYTLPDQGGHTAIGSNGTIYVGCEDYYLYAINPDGTLKWRYLMSTTMGGSFYAIDANNNILSVEAWAGNHLTALNSEGNLKWSALTGYSFGSLPIIGINGVVYIGEYAAVTAIYEGDQTELQVVHNPDPENNINNDGGNDSGCFIDILNYK